MRRTNFATILVVLGSAWVYGCSSAETPGGDDTATGGTGGATGGTGGATGGTGGATGGTGGTGGSTGGSTGGTGTTVPPECKGIKGGAACTPEGLACMNLVCGLGDSGSRTCNCTGLVWGCSACDWTNSPYAWAKSKPADITTCNGSEQDGIVCGTLNATCEGATGGEACVCFIDDEGAQIWDCDKPPGTWAAAAN